jgi:tetratricopeptide (TPR) repeat protein
MLAYHYSESDNLEKACQYLTLSGEKAVRNYSTQEALVYYKQALQALKELPESEENKRKVIELIWQMTIPMAFLGFPEDSLQILKQGESLCLELGDENSLAYFYSRISSYYRNRGETQLAIEHSENGFWQAEKVGDLDLMVQTSFPLTINYLTRGHFHKLIEIASGIILLIEESQRQKEDFNFPNIPYSIFCSYFGLALGYLGNFDEGQMYFEKGLGVATEMGDVITLGMTECLYGLFWINKGDGKKAIEHCQKSIHHIELAEFPILLGLSWSFLGYGYYLLGDLDTARSHCQKGLEIQTQSGSVWILCLPYVYLAQVEYHSGDLNKAQSLAENALTLAQDNGEKHNEALSLYTFGIILSKINPEQISQADDMVLKGIEIAKELDLKLYLALGYSYLGECFANSDQKDKAIENLETAVKMFHGMGIGYYLARTYSIYADLHKKEGDYSKAKENLNKAIDILKECGADGWVEQYEKELAAIS